MRFYLEILGSIIVFILVLLFLAWLIPRVL